MMQSLLYTEVGMWASAANLPSISPGTGMILLNVRNRAVEALNQGVAIVQPSMREDIQQYIDALDLVCGVAAIQQGEVIKTLETALEREGYTHAKDGDSTGNDPA